MKKYNKAFTIVELVIVIAVIGVLTAVLIPTFTRLVKKSKISADTQLVKNLNVLLSADKVETTHFTYSEVLEYLSENGYKTSDIKSKVKGNEILWDLKNDLFCYFNNGEIEYYPEGLEIKKENTYNYWKIFDQAIDVNNEFSIYVDSTACAQSLESREINVGIDCGKYPINDIRYVNTNNENARETTIYTNDYNTNVTINAPFDVVNHLGKAGSVNIIAVAEESYHEYGKVPFVEIAGGNLVLEKTSDVASIYLNSTDGQFKNGELTISIDITNSLTQPTLSRDNVSIGENGTYIVKIIDDTPKYVWIIGDGSEQNTVVTNDNTAIAENGVIKVGVSQGVTTDSFIAQLSNDGEGKAKLSKEESKQELYDLLSGEDAPTNELIDGVAKIDDVIYQDFQSALDAVATDGINVKIVLFDDITQRIIIESGKNVTIDFNGHSADYSQINSISGAQKVIIVIEEGAVLSLLNADVVFDLDSAVCSSMITNSGELSLSGNFTSTRLNGTPFITNQADATLTITDATIHTRANNSCIINRGSIEINGNTTIKNDDSEIFNNYSQLTINNGTFYGATTMDSYTIIIENNEYAEVTINGGTFICVVEPEEGYRLGYVAEPNFGYIYIKGGSFNVNPLTPFGDYPSDVTDYIIINGNLTLQNGYWVVEQLLL